MLCAMNPKSGVWSEWRCRLAIVLTTGMCFTSTAAAPSPPQPNIVFLYADDLGYGDLGSYGSKVAATPNLDRLAREGTRFTQFYVSHCVCSPTRASAITGQYPSRHRIFGHLATMKNNAARGMPDWLDVNAPSVPRALQRAGYRTAMIGKWHLGGGSGRVYGGNAINHPEAPPVSQYGFDHVRTSFGNSPTWRHAETWPEPHDIYPYEDPGWLRWSSRAIADDAIAFVREHQHRHRDQPFYMNVWFKDPHTPFRPTTEMLEPFLNLSEPARTHYAMIHFMDRQIGRLMRVLDEMDLRSRTLVLFSSDNGAVEGRGGSNGALRAWKWYLYEGGIRVPLIARWPGQVPAGRVDTNSALNIVDFAPTFCQLTGATMPAGYESDGVDMTAALFGQPFRRAKPMIWHHPTAAERSPSLAIRDADWKLLMNPDGARLALYDLATDPGERREISENHPQIVQRLKRELLEWYGSVRR